MTSALLGNVYLRTLLDHRRAIIGYGLGIGLLALITGAFYPTIRDQAEVFQQLAEGMPPALAAFAGDFSDLTSPAGYLRGRMFALVLPVLFIVYAITKGSDVIGGEEERGTLDVLLAQPISRVHAFVQKAAGVVTGLATLALATLIAVAAIDLGFAMGVPITNVIAATASLLLLSLVHGSLALGLTGIGLRRAAAASATVAFAFAGYLLNAFALLSDDLRVLRPLSPFAHYAEPDPIKNGWDPTALAVLLGLALVPGITGLFWFRRRDVAV